jgi:hypothetical protein
MGTRRHNHADVPSRFSTLSCISNARILPSIVLEMKNVSHGGGLSRTVRWRMSQCLPADTITIEKKSVRIPLWMPDTMGTRV